MCPLCCCRSDTLNAGYWLCHWQSFMLFMHVLFDVIYVCIIWCYLFMYHLMLFMYVLFDVIYVCIIWCYLCMYYLMLFMYYFMLSMYVLFDVLYLCILEFVYTACMLTEIPMHWSACFWFCSHPIPCVSLLSLSQADESPFSELKVPSC